MKYSKPQVVAVGAASAEIQGLGRKNPYRDPDADITSLFLSTGGSYDLDE
jgi:hypothetical protein